jgi:hypothetical protein
MNQLDISHFSLAELKSLGFDLMVEIERQQNNLRIVQAEIAKRNSQIATPLNNDIVTEPTAPDATPAPDTETTPE